MANKGTARFLNILFLLIQLVTVIGLISEKDYNFAVEGILVFVIYVFYMAFEAKNGIFIENYIRLLVMISLIGNSLIGALFGLYETSTVFDKLLHAYGGFTFSMLAFSFFDKLLKPKYTSKVVTFITVMSIGVTLGVFYEFVEFAADVILKDNNQKGLTDTDLDLLADALGAAAAGLYVVRRGLGTSRPY